MKYLKVVAALMVAAALASSASAKNLKVGQAAPNFELVLANGQKLHLVELRGQVVLLNYWATWCVPCRTELPLLNGYFIAATERHYPLRIFAVATEDSVPKYQLKKLFSVLSISPTDKIRGGPFANVDGLPTNYVIDKAGVLRYAKAGAFDADDLNRILIPLLNEPAPAQ